jgi:hypothetical protein
MAMAQPAVRHGFAGVYWDKQARKWKGIVVLTAEELEELGDDVPESLRTGAVRPRLTTGSYVTEQEAAHEVDKCVGLACPGIYLHASAPAPQGQLATLTGITTSCADRGHWAC